MKSIESLHEAAAKITEFGRQFCSRSYSTSAKAWKFNPDCALASVWAYVSDDEGSIDAGQEPAGEVSLRLDIEFFREPAGQDERREQAENAAGAEAEVIAYVRSLGFEAESNGDGSGEYGSISCYLLA